MQRATLGGIVEQKEGIRGKMLKSESSLQLS